MKKATCATAASSSIYIVKDTPVKACAFKQQMKMSEIYSFLLFAKGAAEIGKYILEPC